ncbi:LapD/MoxY N-terminal periplasmic domain-containing protein [Microbulbifer pacificus]|uniref:LapD/MoxY N-terminal periplasmic domain-containing protein n=1 Tax=Microbulbifer pacificus TaxID=407164 RepID=UPI000CF48954|nr:LapD/MoxY N-terminal periplasmic domain-containing protein [Microbulbifer pacificus]
MNRRMLGMASPIAKLIAAWCVITTAVLSVGLLTARSQLQALMTSESRDNAALMAVALGPYTGEKDTLFRATLLKALTESGAYKEVRYTAVNGTKIRQTNLDYLPDVPHWFQQLLVLETPRATSEVRSGWDLAGHIAVDRQPAAGYRLLWQTALGIAGVCLMGLTLALWWQSALQTRIVHAQQERDGLKRSLENTRALLHELAGAAPEIADDKELARLLEALRSDRPIETINND